jgi:hypothetical protein
MTIVKYADIQTNIANVFDMAIKEPVLITRRDGYSFTLTSSVNSSYELKSPYEDIAGVDTNVTMKDILDAIHDRKEP